MASTARKWLVGCGLGCGGAIVISIAAPLLFGLVAMRPMNRAVDAQKELTAAMGDRDSYSPPAGVPAPERLEAFLAVRRAVLPQCERFTKIAADFARMDELGAASDKPGKGELFRAVTRLSGSVLGIVGDIGQLTEARNQALLDQKMGLGEYTWLYTLIYHSWLEHPVPGVSHRRHGEDVEAGKEGQEKHVHVRRQRAALIGMMRRHAGALTAAGQAEQAQRWRDEADRMEQKDADAPFADGGLPPEWAAAFAARGDELRATWCEPMAEYELGEVTKSGLSINAN